MGFNVVVSDGFAGWDRRLFLGLYSRNGRVDDVI